MSFEVMFEVYREFVFCFFDYVMEMSFEVMFNVYRFLVL